MINHELLLPTQHVCSKPAEETFLGLRCFRRLLHTTYQDRARAKTSHRLRLLRLVCLNWLLLKTSEHGEGEEGESEIKLTTGTSFHFCAACPFAGHICRVASGLGLASLMSRTGESITPSMHQRRCLNQVRSAHIEAPCSLCCTSISAPWCRSCCTSTTCSLSPYSRSQHPGP